MQLIKLNCKLGPLCAGTKDFPLPAVTTPKLLVMHAQNLY
jgi:hypothetical protein